MAAYVELIKGLESTEDFTATVDQLMEGFEPRGRGRELSMLMTAWAHRDPETALNYTAKFGDWQGRYAAYTALGVWLGKPRSRPRPGRWKKAKTPSPKKATGTWWGSLEDWLKPTSTLPFPGPWSSRAAMPAEI